DREEGEARPAAGPARRCAGHLRRSGQGDPPSRIRAEGPDRGGPAPLRGLVSEARMNICMVGTGYVGLLTGTGLADFGMDVVCGDMDEGKIRSLQAGKVPIYEPGLEELVAKNERAGRLRFTTDLKSAVESSLAIFIAVGTPPLPDGSADLTYVRQVAES